MHVHAELGEEMQAKGWKEELCEERGVVDGLGVLPCQMGRWQICLLTRKGARRARLAKGANLTSRLSVP